MSEKFIGRDVSYSFDGGATWATLGQMIELAEDSEPVVGDPIVLGSFSFSGTLELKECNPKLVATARWPDSKPWLKRKKGRS